MVYGVYPPIITIFDEEGGIDYEANKKQTDFLIHKGVDGITYLGTPENLLHLPLKKENNI